MVTETPKFQGLSMQDQNEWSTLKIQMKEKLIKIQ